MKTTVVKIAIHSDDINPFYGEGVIYAEIVDEGGGCFVKLSDGDGSIRINPDELYTVADRVRELTRGFP